jgi:hypothetical protein
MVLLLVGLVGAPLGLAGRWASFQWRAAYHAALERECLDQAKIARGIADSIMTTRLMSWENAGGPTSRNPPPRPPMPTFETLSSADQRAILDARKQVYQMSMRALYHARMRIFYENRW